MLTPVVVFAQTPPPEHGQSRMVLLALETLERKPDQFEVHHVNARFSESLEDIGESSLRKGVLIARYLVQAIRLRFRVTDPLLYYVPGPVKWSSVIRDWVLLAILRRLYRKTVFHWHAIGQGEWAHGSERLRLEGPDWMDRLARSISARVLARPFASIPVSGNSRKDSIAVDSRNERIIPNGIADPCPEYESDLAPLRMERRRELQQSNHPCFCILFLSHGTLEKGVIDALDCMAEVLKLSDPTWIFEATFAGSISESVSVLFEHKADALVMSAAGRIVIHEEGYLKGDAKHRCFARHDIFLSPSRWESFGLTVLEAMAHGMPVVAAASDGVIGVLPNGYPYLAPVANPVVLAAKLLQCCQSIREEPEQEASQSLRNLFLANYQIQYFAENLVQVITELGELEGGERPKIGEPVLQLPKLPVLQLPAARCFGESATEERKSERRSTASSSSDLGPSTFRPSDSSVSPSETEELVTADRAGSALPASDSSSADLRPSTFRPSDSSVSPSETEELVTAHRAGSALPASDSSSADLRPSTFRPSDSSVSPSDAEELVTAHRAGSALPSSDSSSADLRPSTFRPSDSSVSPSETEELVTADRAGSALPASDSSSADLRPSTFRPSDSSVSPSDAEELVTADRAGSALPASDSSSSDLRPSTFRPSDSSVSPSETEELVTADRAGSALPASDSSSLSITAYLADQNPGHDRSFGISRMSQVVLEALQKTGRAQVRTITSKTSQQAPNESISQQALPWGTRNKVVRLLTDHFHPLFCFHSDRPNIYYYPKGYLPLVSGLCRPSVVTIHDTIIQYDEDHYPTWRKPSEYRYWAMMLKHTLRQADLILTVSESSKRQIQDFMERHGIPINGITVTYEPCLYERIPQPVASVKENYVVHLASCEPHKRTAHLIRWWHEAESQGRNLPMLQLIGTVPPEVESLLGSSHSIVKSPFLEEAALQAAYRSARALILPSEVEGFGLPALEAYYLGTPVCFVCGTSVEEVLGVVTSQGRFSLESSDSLFAALDEVMAIPEARVRESGLKLREVYASEKVAERMIRAFEEVKW
jgi:glycosyltransferase involved in cell wall biosynthesis